MHLDFERTKRLRQIGEDLESEAYRHRMRRGLLEPGILEEVQYHIKTSERLLYQERSLARERLLESLTVLRQSDNSFEMGIYHGHLTGEAARWIIENSWDHLDNPLFPRDGSSISDGTHEALFIYDLERLHAEGLVRISGGAMTCPNKTCRARKVPRVRAEHRYFEIYRDAIVAIALETYARDFLFKLRVATGILDLWIAVETQREIAEDKRLPRIFVRRALERSPSFSALIDRLEDSQSPS